MKQYVIDFQAFKAPNSNEFIIKELALVGVDTNYVAHYYVKPPVSYYTLNPEFQNKIDYVTKHIHGIPWDYGDISFPDMLQAIRAELGWATEIYIRNKERAKEIKQLIKSSNWPIWGEPAIIDLDDVDGFESMNIPPRRNNFNQCSLGTSQHLTTRCSLEQATRYRDVLKNLLNCEEM